MSMYRPYSNTTFNNCYDFIMKSKAEKEVWELSTSLTFDDEEEMRWELDRISDLARDIMNAEYDLCEMEMDAFYDAEKYDAVLNGNASRKGRNRKAQRNGKRNADKAKRLHKADRYHGKSLEPYLYKENGIIKESIEDVWRNCRMPVSNKVHNHSALRADAREKDFYRSLTLSELREKEAAEESVAEENRILDNHYTVEDALSNLKEGKYISLLSYWNGEYWEESVESYNQFCGIETTEQVKDSVLTEQARHQNLPEIKKETIHGIEGISFKWNGYWDEYYREEGRGYITLTFLPIN